MILLKIDKIVWPVDLCEIEIVRLGANDLVRLEAVHW